MRGHHSTVYIVLLDCLVLCLGCLGGHVCVMLASGVGCVGCILVSGLAVEFDGLAIGLFLDGLLRPLMLTCMVCFAGGVGSGDLARLATPAKLVAMSGCLEARRSRSDVSPLGRLLIEFTSKPYQRLAIMVDRVSGFESISVRESRCS